MINRFVLSGMLFAMFAMPVSVIAAETVRLSEPVASDAESETFGAALPSDVEAQPLAAVMDESERWLGEPVVVSARIGEVCQKKGCFFIARDGDVVVRVTFKDYGFFIPTDSGGKRATFAGVIERVDVTPEQRIAHAAVRHRCRTEGRRSRPCGSWPVRRPHAPAFVPTVAPRTR